MSLHMLWPIAVAVGAELVYQICAKSTPAEIDPFASLTVTYLIGAVTSAVIYFLLHRGGDLMREYSHLNWTALAMGIAIVGLEVGGIYMYKVGWTVSTGPLVKNVSVIVLLTLVGMLVYREVLTPSKFVGIALCLAGVVLLNR